MSRCINSIITICPENKDHSLTGITNIETDSLISSFLCNFSVSWRNKDIQKNVYKNMHEYIIGNRCTHKTNRFFFLNLFLPCNGCTLNIIYLLAIYREEKILACSTPTFIYLFTDL